MYVKKFKKRKTSSLIKGYSRYNAEFRAHARNELKRRKVPKKSLPYKSRKSNRPSSSYGMFGNMKSLF